MYYDILSLLSNDSYISCILPISSLNSFLLEKCPGNRRERQFICLTIPGNRPSLWELKVKVSSTWSSWPSRENPANETYAAQKRTGRGWVILPQPNEMPSHSCARATLTQTIPYWNPLCRWVKTVSTSQTHHPHGAANEQMTF